MFAPVLKIVRALLCALALALIGVGAHVSLRAEANASDTEVDLDASKRAKPTSVLSARLGAACPLALAAGQANAARVWAPASTPFVRFFVSPGCVVSVAPITREKERQTWPRARAGVVRLLI